MIEWVLSPKTNLRSDAYGGSFENRMRFLRGSCGRSANGSARTSSSACMNMVERGPLRRDRRSGDRAGACRPPAASVTLLRDGQPWGNLSYIQPHYYQRRRSGPALSQALRRHLTLPISTLARPTARVVAEAVIAAGMADVVWHGAALLPSATGQQGPRRAQPGHPPPASAATRCIRRQYMEAIPLACTVNPSVGTRSRSAWRRAWRRRLLVMAAAGLLAWSLRGWERGTSREHGREAALGGQMALAAARAGLQEGLSTTTSATSNSRRRTWASRSRARRVDPST